MKNLKRIIFGLRIALSLTIGAASFVSLPIATISLSSLPTPAYSQFTFSKAELGIRKFEAESVSLFARGSFTNEEKLIINDCIKKLKDDSQWSLIKTLKVMGVSTQANSLLDWVNASYNGTKVGSPTFTAYEGWTGTGSTSDYIRSGFNPNGVMSLNSSIYGAMALGDETTASILFGCQNAANEGVLLIPKSTTTTISRLHSAANDNVTTTGRPVGIWTISRTSSANYDEYIVETLKSTIVKVSSSVPNLEIYFLVSNNNGTPGSAGLRQIALFYAADGTADKTKINSALNDCSVRLNALALGNKQSRGYAVGERLAFQSYRYGGLIDWTNNIPFGTDVYTTNKTSPVDAVSGFHPSGVNVQDWIDAAVAAQMEYLVLTVKHNSGWRLFPFSTDLVPYTGKDSYNATISLPQYTNYGVNNASIIGSTDQDIVHRFVAACKVAGIKPVLYYNIGKDLNARGGFDGIVNSSFSSDGTIAAGYAAYTTMVNAHLRELLQTFPGIWLWLDATAWYPRTGLADVFNTVRQYGGENCLVYYNYDPPQGSGDAGTTLKPLGTNSTYYTGSLDGHTFYLWPFDVHSYEYSRYPTIGFPWINLNAHKKYYYWMGAEISSPMFTPDQWFYWDPAVVGGSPNVVDSEANLNARADIANANGAPFLLALSPNAAGVISTDQKNRAIDVGNHIFP